MLEVTFMGTSGSVPTVERGMPALTIKYESSLLLFDCGEGTQRQMMRYKVGFGSIDAIFISHSHLDHYIGLFGLLETLHLGSAAPRKVDIFLPKSMGDPFTERHNFVKLHPTRKGEIYKGKGFSISAFPVKHNRGSYGFIFQEEDKVKFHEKKAKDLGIKGRMFGKIQRDGYILIDNKRIELDEVTWRKPGRKIVYSGDCPFCEETVEAAQDADLLIHEGTFDIDRAAEAMERRHSTVEDAAKVAKAAGVEKLIITHISPRYSDEVGILLKNAKKTFKNTVIAEDGMRVAL
jgi:ribonuclease Z